MESLQGKALINQRNQIIMAEQALAKAKIIIFFFSASWCDQCINLIPQLKEIYEESKKRDLRMEIINVSNDTTQSEMSDNFKLQGDWYSVLYGDVLAEELRWTYNVTYVPSIVVLTKSGQIISKQGYRDVQLNGINVLITWVT